jgi:hypothetical protein
VRCVSRQRHQQMLATRLPPTAACHPPHLADSPLREHHLYLLLRSTGDWHLHAAMLGFLRPDLLRRQLDLMRHRLLQQQLHQKLYHPRQHILRLDSSMESISLSSTLMARYGMDI